MFLYIILVLFCGFGMFGFWVLIWYAGVLGLGGGGGGGGGGGILLVFIVLLLTWFHIFVLLVSFYVVWAMLLWGQLLLRVTELLLITVCW